MAFKLSPEFADGCSFMIVKTKKELLDAVDMWADVMVDGRYKDEPATIEYVDRTDAEIDALPEI